MKRAGSSGFSLTITALLIVCAIAFSRATLAQTLPQYLNSLQRSKYTVYAADVNGDGRTDILMKANRTIIMIDLDILIPVPLRTPSPTFVLLSNGADSYALNASPDSATINNGAWQLNHYDLRYGDLLGNGAGGVVIEARNAADPSFSVAANGNSGQPIFIQALTPAAIEFDLSAAGVTSELADRNGDGRADLVIRQAGVVASVLLANTGGVFIKDDETTIRAVWSALRACLDADDAGCALGYISVESIPAYSDLLASLGTHLHEAGATWSDIRAVSISAQFATFTLIDSADGQPTLHYLMFEKENNRWVLDSM